MSAMIQSINSKVTFESISMARERIRHHINVTPVLTSSYFNKMTGKNLFFKCENFQKTGSFKIRGALNSIKRVKEIRGDDDFVVITHSTGNLGQGLALAATQENIKSIVYVPSNTPEVKKTSIRGYGAELRCVDPTPQMSEECIRNLLNEKDNKYERVDNHPFIVEGQGTIALELLEQVPDLDAIIACCGTGGLVSGIAVVTKKLKPNIKIITAEPEMANSAQISLKNKEREVFDHYPQTIAEGLRISVYSAPWVILQDHVDYSLTASEEQIKDAVYLLLERMKILVEPSGAVSTAVLMSDDFQKVTEGCHNIGVIITGGNFDIKSFFCEEN